MVSSALTSTPALTSSTNARPLLAMLVSMLLVVLWAALAVGVVLTVIFPERTISIAGSTASAP
jgi:hypothetical protein